MTIDRLIDRLTLAELIDTYAGLCVHYGIAYGRMDKEAEVRLCDEKWAAYRAVRSALAGRDAAKEGKQ